ncbi:hypothetical protein OPT61_g4581 [Boeremia exigua]|uniref:Uncharacterized protein n=1 Tax=Boeremia exigua TaxID=749465 RepID=A0ACC2IDN3_9PLEO|nr:hypothetical protein OPT61_g4581 [Boeremia exigua]
MRDHIFRLTTSKDHLRSLGETNTVNLILREVESEQDMTTYVLLTSSVCFVATGFGGLGSPFPADFQPNIHREYVPTRFDPYLDMKYIWVSVSDALEQVSSTIWLLGHTFGMLSDLAGFPRDKQDLHRISALCRALWQDREDEKEGSKNRNLFKKALLQSGASSISSLWGNSQGLLSRRIKSVVKQAQDQVLDRGLYIFLECIQHAYTPPASAEEVISMIEQGPTELQRNTGIAKYLGGVKLDGSVFQVRII